MLRPISIQEQVAEDIGAIVHRLQRDQAFILLYWRSQRLRDPLLETLASDWEELDLPQLVGLTPVQAEAAEAFYRSVRRFRAWARWTDAMPETLGLRILAALDEMWPLARAASTELGHRPSSWLEPSPGAR